MMNVKNPPINKRAKGANVNAVINKQGTKNVTVYKQAFFNFSPYFNVLS